MTVGRFAPTPSGRMHLGNVLSAMLAWLSAKSKDGEIVLRIEDLDPNRCKSTYAEQIMDDLNWLGLSWDRRVDNQSLRGDFYNEVISGLQAKEIVYPCFCSRDQLHAASAPHASDGRVIYAGTCKKLSIEERQRQNKKPSYRLILPDKVINTTDGLQGHYCMNLATEFGDIIIRRADGVAAYQLAVVIDDAANGVTEVVRGRDLLSSTPVQQYIYQLLNLKVPDYYHIPMLMSPEGRRLSKRDRDLDLGVLRQEKTPTEIIGSMAFVCGLIDKKERISAKELLTVFSWERVKREDILVDYKLLFM